MFVSVTGTREYMPVPYLRVGRTWLCHPRCVATTPAYPNTFAPFPQPALSALIRHSERKTNGNASCANTTAIPDLGQAALAKYFQLGGSFMGVHAASAALYNDTTYGEAIGGEWNSVPHCILERPYT